METLLVRLRPFDPRRGQVLRRYTYAGIKFQDDRGWYRVERGVGEYLRSVKQLAGNPLSKAAFDVCTEEEARALDSEETAKAAVKRGPDSDLQVSPARKTPVLRPKASEPQPRPAAQVATAEVPKPPPAVRAPEAPSRPVAAPSKPAGAKPERE